MKSRVYYGEYSLAHWIKLMLSKNIGLPAYQRSFVWGEDRIKRLIESLKDGQFVQPVTIAQNRGTDEVGAENLILDGQQRLTAILLSHLNVVPIDFPVESEEFANEDIPESGEQLSSGGNSIAWTFAALLARIDKPVTIEKIQKSIEGKKQYKKVDFDLPSDFFQKTYLGFSYIVPSEKNEEIIQQGYTKLFRNINYFACNLSPMESRRSLYYTKKTLYNYFEGVDSNGSNVLCGIGIMEQMKNKKIDFLRYLSILSEYFSLKSSDGDFDVKNIQKGYSSFASREIYYADYVAHILQLDPEIDDKKFDKFTFNKSWIDEVENQRYSILRKSVSQLKSLMGLKKEGAFLSWIDADYWLFGLVYHIVFRGKHLCDDFEGIKQAIDNEISEVRNQENYVRAPNRLVYLRSRISQSIKIYSAYVQ